MKRVLLAKTHMQYESRENERPKERVHHMTAHAFISADEISQVYLNADTELYVYIRVEANSDVASANNRSQSLRYFAQSQYAVHTVFKTVS